MMLAYSAGMPSTEVSTPPERLAAVRTAIARAAALAGRPADAVELIAISKTHDAPAIQPLIDAGQRVFGENRVQEAEAKWPALKEATPGIRLHLVGQLQSKKAGTAPTCFIQVNIGEEEQKGGCAIDALPALLDHCRRIALPIAGLMCVPPLETEAAPYFALLAKLARDHGLSGLSMGMSGDYETAAMLGATHVRVGTALFGGRG
jgi:uncharacterized pyridoxal phosphate-containing UPF0001 family protein